MDCVDCNKGLSEYDGGCITLAVANDEETLVECDIALCNSCFEIRYYLMKYPNGKGAA